MEIPTAILCYISFAATLLQLHPSLLKQPETASPGPPRLQLVDSIIHLNSHLQALQPSMELSFLTHICLKLSIVITTPVSTLGVLCDQSLTFANKVFSWAAAFQNKKCLCASLFVLCTGIFFSKDDCLYHPRKMKNSNCSFLASPM